MSALATKLEKTVEGYKKEAGDAYKRIQVLTEKVMEADSVIAELTPYKAKYESTLSDLITKERELDELREAIESL